MTEGKKYTVWHQAKVTLRRRQVLNKHKAVNLWSAGLASFAKYTIVQTVEEWLHQLGRRISVFDRCNIRRGQLARNGLFKHCTAISSPYEAHGNPALRLNTGLVSAEECVEQVICFFRDKEIISSLGQPDFHSPGR